MYEQSSRLQNFWQNTTTTQKIAIFVIPLALIAIIIIAIISLIRQNSSTEPTHITLTNYSESTKAPAIIKQRVETTIWNTLNLYNNIPDTTFADATIRQDSVSEYKPYPNQDGMYTQFIVDIPTLKHSFSINYNWYSNYQPTTNAAENDFEIFINCPSYNEVIYQETDCETTNNPYDQLDKYLPYQGNTDSGTQIRIVKELIDPSAINSSLNNYLAVFINACGDETKIAEAEPFTKQWLEKRLLSNNHYTTKVLNVCEEKEVLPISINGKPDYGWANSLTDE